MVDIRIKDLPLEATPNASEFLAIDLLSTRSATIQSVVEIGRPAASQAEAEAGTNPTKVMTPLTVSQAVSFYGLTKAGNLAGLADLPTARANLGLGGAAILNVGTTAGTVAAGDDSRIVNSVQNTRTITAGTGLTGGGDLSADRTIALNGTSIASLAKADTAVQPTATTSITPNTVGTLNLGSSANPWGSSFINTVQAGTATTLGLIVLNGPTSTSRSISMRTASVARGVFGLSNEAESGSDAGSRIQLLAFNDAGTISRPVFFAARATGKLTFNVRPDVTGAGDVETQNNKGIANGYASLNASTKIPLAQIPTGRAIGNVLAYEDVASIPSIILDSKIIFKKNTPTNNDAWDVRVFRDATAVTGGSAGNVNATLLVDVETGATQTSLEWGILGKLTNNSAAGENTAGYFQATKAGQGPTWSLVLETRELTTATYGALVGLENAVSANGLDPSNVRVITDIIGARFDDSATIPEFFAGARITAAWNGSGAGVESAKLKRPLLIDANWTDVAVFAIKREDIPTGATSVVKLIDMFVPDGGNNMELMTHFTKTTAGAGAANTGLFIDRLTDSTLVGRIAFNGDRSIDINTGSGGTTIKLKHGAGVVLPTYTVNPVSPTEGECWFIATGGTNQFRAFLGGAVRNFVPV